MTLRMRLTGLARLACTIGLAIAGGLLLPVEALAVTFTVNSTDDGADISPGDGNCSTVDPPAQPVCTLRAAVMEANRTTGLGAIIKLPASVVPYFLKIDPKAPDDEKTGDLNLFVPSGYTTGPTQIIGDGAAFTIVDANGIDRILSIENRTVSISGLTMRNGFAASPGGGIYCDGHLTLTEVIISDNTSTSVGGGIYLEVSGSLVVVHSELNNNTGLSGGGISAGGNHSATISESTLSGNHSTNSGGAIYNQAGGLTLSRSTLSGNTSGFGGGLAISSFMMGYSAVVAQSTISGNSASKSGGGIANGDGSYDDGSLYLSNSTIAGNAAVENGGGIYNSTTSHVYNSTIAYNQSDSNADNIGLGSGVFNAAGSPFYLRNSVVAANTYPGPYGLTLYEDCYGALTAFGKNRFYSLNGCSVTQADGGSTTALVPFAALGALRDNGGPTQTIELLAVAGANLIDYASNCVDNNGALNTDQRGRPRPLGASCDVGAFEYDPGDIFINGFQ